MKKVLILGLLLTAVIAWTDITATSKDFRKFLLKDDGTWEEIPFDKDLEEPSEFNFRQTRWGMDMEQVRASEEMEVYQEETDSIAYETQVAMLDCLLIYKFYKQQLIKCTYVITEKHTNDNAYISDYEYLLALLKDKYGEPKSEEIIWKNDLCKDDRNEWGFAVSIGHLVYQSGWVLEDTTILFFLYGDNYYIGLDISYEGKDISAAMRKAEKHNL